MLTLILLFLCGGVDSAGEREGGIQRMNIRLPTPKVCPPTSLPLFICWLTGIVVVPYLIQFLQKR